MKLAPSLFLLAFCGILTMPAAAQPSPPMTKFLVPLYGFTSGLGGAVWSAQLRYLNTADVAVSPQPQPCELPITCGGTTFRPNTDGVVDFLPRVGAVSPARLIYVPSAVTGSQLMQVRLYSPRERTQEGVFEAAGIEVPVLKEDDCLRSTAYFLGVRLSTTHRLMLRLYDVDSHPVSLVEVRFRSQGILLVTRTIPLLTGGTTFMGLPTEPAYAQVGDLQSIPELRNLIRVTIEVIPVTPGLRFFALVSSTDYATNDVEIYTPLGGHSLP